jgi:arylsulfatase A-like enzyme
VDRHLGRLLGALESSGVRDRTLVAVVTDHGQLGVHTRIDLPRFFLDLGLDLKDKPLLEWDSRVNEYDAVVASAGNSMAHVYLAREGARPREGRLLAEAHDWSARPDLACLRSYPVRGETVDLVERVRKLDGLDLLLVRDGPDAVRVFSPEGEARVTRRGDTLAYEALAGPDPLGYSDDARVAPLVGPAGASRRRWLEASAASVRPDAVVQIAQVMSHERTGDLVLATRPGWDFKTPGLVLKGSHGGFTRGDMRVPMILNGPGVIPGRLPAASVLDLHPVLLAYLGVDAPASDGDPATLADAFENGSPGRRERLFRRLDARQE